MIDVLCIGTAAYDINIPLESFPEENLKVHVDSFLEEGGGPASNAAYLLSKWGIKCGFAGLIGDDIYGRRIEEEFKAVNTDLSLLSKRKDFDTPLSIVMVNKKNGSRTIINRRKSGIHLEFNSNMLKRLSPKAMLFDGHELDASLAAMEAFPKAKTILDAGSLRKGTEVLARKVDYLVSSERFALSVTGLSDLKSEDNQRRCIDELKKLSTKQVVVTLGEKGLIYEDKGCFRKMEAYPVDVVDTTGAGDIFHGAFTYGVLKGLQLIDILKLASMTASLSVSKSGGRQSIPTLEHVMQQLHGYGVSLNS